MSIENFKSKFDWKFYVMYHKISKIIQNESQAWCHACTIGCKTPRDVFKSKELSTEFRIFMRKSHTEVMSTVEGL